MPELPDKKKRINWIVLLRDVHVYASLSLFAVYFFFGLTGFLANRPEWFVDEPDYKVEQQAVAEGVALTEAELIPALKAMFPGTDSHSDFDNDGEETVVTLTGSESIFEIMVINEDRSIRVETWLRLPDELKLTRGPVVAWFGERYSGHLDEKSYEGDDADADTIDFNFASVWESHSISIDKQGRRYQVSSQEAGFAQALIDIHRSKHAGFWQTILIDITALLLVLTSATGALYGFVGKAKKRKRVAVILIGVSFVFLVFLILGR